MARRAKGTAFDPKQSYSLTNQIIADLSCPEGKGRVYFRDSVAPGLNVMVTQAGAKVFYFERKFRGDTIRKSLGDVRTLTLQQARTQSREAFAAYDMGVDFFADREAEIEARQKAHDIAVINAAFVWAEYIKEKSTTWSKRNTDDHVGMSRKGGGIRLRAPKQNGAPIPLTEGMLYPLLQQPLSSWNEVLIDDFVTKHRFERPGRLRLALRLLSGFVGWCNNHPAYKGLTPSAADLIRNSRIKSLKGSPQRRTDNIAREDLQAFFSATRRYANHYFAAYVMVMILTGGRPSEIRTLMWTDINFSKGYIHLRDKVEGFRYVPLTTFVMRILKKLPRINEWVFASPGSETGRIHTPTKAFTLLCRRAGIPHCTLHGLRRSFATLVEWMDETPPAGVVAQIMGHKPSATAEKHYKVRPLEMLRMYHQRIEGYILVQAGIDPLGVIFPKALPSEEVYHCEEVEEIEDERAEFDHDAASDAVLEALLNLPSRAPVLVAGDDDTIEVEAKVIEAPVPVPVPEAPSAEQIFLLAHATPLVAEPLPAPVVVDPDVDHELFYGTPPAEQGEQAQGSLF